MIHETYLSFYSAKDILTQPQLVNYEQQIRAGAALSYTVAQGKRPFAVMIFGIPGTGKGLFPFTLAKHVREGYGIHFSLAHIKCDELVTIQNVSQALDMINRIMILSEKHSPTFIVFDEIDALSASLPGLSSVSAVYTRLMRKLVRDLPSQTLMIGITNYPNNIDFAVRRRFQVSIYMEPTTVEITTKIIERILNRTDSEKLAQKLWEKLEENAFVPLGSDIAKACEMARELYASEDQQLSPERLVELLSATMPGANVETVKDYEQKHADLINRSKYQQEYWSKRYAEILRK